MNRGALERPQVQQQMMAGNTDLWNINNMKPSPQQPSPFLPSSSSFSSILPQYALPTSLPLASCHENQDLPESWSQMLLRGLVGDENRCSFGHFHSKKMDSWEDQMLFPSSSVHVVDVKQESPEGRYVYGHESEEFQTILSPWNQVLPASSPRCCVSSFTSNILDFSHPKLQERHQEPDHSSESIGTATGAPFKKAKVQSSSVQSTFKVRKEKLGDRVTALHQLVSPFGKTDTASVLLEAIGYIRFLQSQIQVLSSPYLATAPSGKIMQLVQGERNCIFPEDPGQLLNDTFMKRRGAPEKGALDGPKKDLRTRGLCLVPIACTQQIGSDNGADYWVQNLGGGFH
ncbi:transcription factor bHLH68-like protein [Cinnamomum micranthum f. kanehirae]|uniref:Transcription factor bHLH68-like protein n=1 Tax=Cinnamomum micranthum f. kanehirae TaxID=337451 RepID=A0A3S3Q3A9_9MAGN|nr:transcription factor bHLH68-like protein [Cinnamomum micranthum f. kanehirae]